MRGLRTTGHVRALLVFAVIFAALGTEVRLNEARDEVPDQNSSLVARRLQTSPTPLPPTARPTAGQVGKDMRSTPGPYVYRTYHRGKECLSLSSSYTVQKEQLGVCLEPTSETPAPHVLSCRKRDQGVKMSLFSTSYGSTDTVCSSAAVSGLELSSKVYECAPDPRGGKGYVFTQCGDVSLSLKQRPQVLLKAYIQATGSSTATCTSDAESAVTHAYILDACIDYMPAGRPKSRSPAPLYYRKLTLAAAYTGNNIVLTESRYTLEDNRCLRAPFLTKTITYSGGASGKCIRDPLDSSLTYTQSLYYKPQDGAAGWAQAESFINGNYIPPYMVWNPVVTHKTSTASISAMVFDSAGNMLVTMCGTSSNDGQVVKLTKGSSWTPSDFTAKGSYGSCLQSIAMSVPKDKIYFAQSNNNVYMLAYPAGGAATLLDYTNDATFLDGPRSIAADAAGNVYVTSAGNARVLMYSPATGKSKEVFNGGNNYSGFYEAAPSTCQFYKCRRIWSGPIVVYYPTQTYVFAIAIDSKDNVFIANPHATARADGTLTDKASIVKFNATTAIDYVTIPGVMSQGNSPACNGGTGGTCGLNDHWLATLCIDPVTDQVYAIDSRSVNLYSANQFGGGYTRIGNLTSEAWSQAFLNYYDVKPNCVVDSNGAVYAVIQGPGKWQSGSWLSTSEETPPTNIYKITGAGIKTWATRAPTRAPTALPTP